MILLTGFAQAASVSPLRLASHRDLLLSPQPVLPAVELLLAPGELKLLEAEPGPDLSALMLPISVLLVALITLVAVWTSRTSDSH
jgi:hypothetical protein